MEGFSLTVAVLSADAALRRELEQGCEAREHLVLDLDRLRDLRHRDDVDVVVLDLPGGPDENLTVACAIRAVDQRPAIVLVGDDGVRRSHGGFRVIDRWRTGPRLVDDLELAYIGIPATPALRVVHG